MSPHLRVADLACIDDREPGSFVVVGFVQLTGLAHTVELPVGRRLAAVADLGVRR